MKLVLFIFCTLVSRGRADDDDVLRWSSAGGGWRNFVTNMAYANIFAQAELFGQGESSSKFTALSGQSGGSWFAALFFYSNNFYAKTTTSSPTELAEFVSKIMDSNRDYTTTFFKKKAPICIPVSLLADAQDIPDIDTFCGLFLALDGDWAAINEGMLNAVSQNFDTMSDADSTASRKMSIASRKMNRENRIPPLASTDMYLQMAILPNSRVRSLIGPDTVSYIGLEGGDKIYSVPLAVQWSVTDQYAAYISNTPGGSSFPSKMVTYVDPWASKTFSFAEWDENFFLYPSTNGMTSVDIPPKATLKGPIREPFGGTPTVNQITAGSTSVPGFYSPLVPSTFAQVMSTQTWESESNEQLLDLMYTFAYNANFLDELAVCSQWPDKCDEHDVRFADGYAVDAPTAALNIGQYQTMQNGDLSKTIKLILTPPNSFGADNPPIYLMSYFSTTFNQGVAPGDFYWPSDKLIVPMSSPQIFEGYLDLEMYADMLDTVDGALGSVLKTTRIQTRTIDNPTYLVKAGQPVDILIFQLSSEIPLGVNGVAAIDRWKGPLVDLAKNIASSSELLARVQDFVSSSSVDTSRAAVQDEDGLLNNNNSKRRGAQSLGSPPNNNATTTTVVAETGNIEVPGNTLAKRG